MKNTIFDIELQDVKLKIYKREKISFKFIVKTPLLEPFYKYEKRYKRLSKTISKGIQLHFKMLYDFNDKQVHIYIVGKNIDEYKKDENIDSFWLEINIQMLKFILINYNALIRILKNLIISEIKDIYKKYHNTELEINKEDIKVVFSKKITARKELFDKLLKNKDKFEQFSNAIIKWWVSFKDLSVRLVNQKEDTSFYSFRIEFHNITSPIDLPNVMYESVKMTQKYFDTHYNKNVKIRIMPLFKELEEIMLFEKKKSRYFPGFIDINIEVPSGTEITPIVKEIKNRFINYIKECIKQYMKDILKFY